MILRKKPMNQILHQRNKLPLFALFKNMFSDAPYLKRVFSIAFPVSMQMMLNMILNFADTLMIGRLGEVEVASVGLGNKFFFVFSLLIFGITSATGVLASQYWGNQDIKNIRKVLGLGLILSVLASLVFFLAAFFMPETIMGLFIETPKPILIGAAYLGVVCFSYPFTAITNVYVSILRAVGEVRIPVIVSIFSITTNVLLNYILIFGNWGAPAMGVVGAALATVIARILESFLIIIFTALSKNVIACSPLSMLGYSTGLIRQFFKTSLPVIANEFMWGLGTTLYSVAYGRMGEDAAASVTIATSLQDLLIVFFQGLAAATLVILGFEMGSNHLKRAERYASYSYAMAILVSFGISLMLLLVRGPFVSLYNLSPNVLEDVKRCLLVFALLLPFKAISAVNIVGILRSGGDTLFGFFLDTTGVWLIGIPMAFLGGLYFRFPVYVVYGMVMIEEIYKTIAGFFRYKQKEWLKNLAIELTA